MSQQQSLSSIVGVRREDCESAWSGSGPEVL